MEDEAGSAGGPDPAVERQRPPAAAQRADMPSGRRNDVLAVPRSFAAAFPHLARGMEEECPNIAELMGPARAAPREELPEIEDLVAAVSAKEKKLEAEEQEAERQKIAIGKQQPAPGEEPKDQANIEHTLERIRKKRAEEVDGLKITLEIGLRTGSEHQELPEPDTDLCAPPTAAIVAFLQPGGSGSALHAVLQVLLRMPQFVREVRKAARRNNAPKLAGDLEKLERAAKTAAQTRDKDASAKHAAAARESFEAVRKELLGAAGFPAARDDDGEAFPENTAGKSPLWDPMECFRRIMDAMAPTAAVQDPFIGTLARAGGTCACCFTTGQVVPSSTTHFPLKLQDTAGGNVVSDLVHSFFAAGGAGPAEAACDQCGWHVAVSGRATASRWPQWLLAVLRGPAAFLPGPASALPGAAAAAAAEEQAPQTAFADTHFELAANNGAGVAEHEQGRYRLRCVLMPAAPEGRCPGEKHERAGGREHRGEPSFEIHWCSPAQDKWWAVRDSACVAVGTPPIATRQHQPGNAQGEPGMPARGFAGIPPDAICFYQHRETEPPPMPKRGENKIQANAGQAGSTWAAFTASLAAPGWREELQQWASIAEAIAAPGWDEGGPEPAPRAEKNAEIDDKAEEDAEKEKPPEAPVELMRLIKSRICEPWQPYIQAQAELYAAEEAEEIPGDHEPAEEIPAGYGAENFDGPVLSMRARKRLREPAASTHAKAAPMEEEPHRAEGRHRNGDQQAAPEPKSRRRRRRNKSTSSSSSSSDASEEAQADERELLRTVEKRARVMGKDVFPLDETWLRAKFEERPLKDMTKAWVAWLWTYLIASTPDPLPGVNSSSRAAAPGFSENVRTGPGAGFLSSLSRARPLPAGGCLWLCYNPEFTPAQKRCCAGSAESFIATARRRTATSR